MDILTQPESGPRVVIVGAGFGGLNAAKKLRKAKLQVTLIDRHNHHLFQPLLYQVATAALSPSDISYPVRAIFSRDKNVRVLLGEVVSVDAERRRVCLRDGEVPYDYLVLATGAKYFYFGRDDWERNAPGLKSLEDALTIRRRLLLAYERAEREPDPKRRQALLTFVIVGGGPTGVELAGAIAEIAREVLVDDFREIDPKDTRVILVEAGARVLETFPPDLSERAERSLRDLKVWVWKNRRVTDVKPDHVLIDGQRVDTYTTLWAAGVSASELGRAIDSPRDHRGRLTVNSDLSLPGQPRIFAIGDLANFEHDGQSLPGIAPVAIQQGRHVAENVMAAVAGKPLAPFRYVDKGNLATIGRASAVAEIGKLKLWGFIAWAAWLVVHILYLIGFRNRIVVTINWGWSYFRMQRGARLIYGDLSRDPIVAPPDRQPESTAEEPQPTSGRT